MTIINLLNENEQKLIKYKHLKKDEVLYYEADLCSYVGIVIEGNIKIVSYLNDGKEIIYNTIKENNMFGNNLIFSSNPYYKGNIISTTDTKVALIYKDDLLSILSSNVEFLKEYLKIHSNFSKELNSKIKLLSISNAIERFYYYLHENNNIIYVKSITQLATNLCLQRETVSKLISKLIKENKIIKRDYYITLKGDKDVFI